MSNEPVCSQCGSDKMYYSGTNIWICKECGHTEFRDMLRKVKGIKSESFERAMSYNRDNKEVTTNGKS
jgi:ribosomal protein L37AE/L43A